MLRDSAIAQKWSNLSMT